MSIPLKIALGVVSLVVLLLVALAVAVTLIIDPNDYRPYIVDAVEDSTGRSFELRGDLGLKLFPCCSVSLGPSRLGNSEGFPAGDFARFQGAALSLKLWPLLSRREMQIGTVTLTGMDLQLIQAADGRANWVFETAPQPEPANDEAAALAGLSVAGVVVEDGRVRYEDQRAGTVYTVSDIELRTGAVAYGDSTVTVTQPELVVTANGAAIPGGAAEASVTAERIVAVLEEQLEVRVDTLTAELQVLKTQVRLSGHGRYGAQSDLKGTLTLSENSPRELIEALTDAPLKTTNAAALGRLSGNAHWQLGVDALSLSELEIRLDDSLMTGDASVDTFEDPAARFDLRIDQLDVDGYLPPDGPDSGMADPHEPTAVPLEALAELDVEGRLRIGTLRASNVVLENVDLELASRDGTVTTALAASGLEGSVKLEGRGNVAAAKPQLTGDLSIDSISPRVLLTRMDAAPETADPNVLTQLSGNSRWRLTPSSLALNEMRWQLDDTELTGTLEIADFDTLATRFELTLDQMNLDGYLAPEDPSAPEESSETEIPVELIRDLDLQGRLRAGQLTLMKLALKNVRADVAAADGVLRLDPLRAALYGGEYRGSVMIDATGPTARLTLDQELSAVQVSQIVKSFFDTNVLAGALTMKLAGSGSGNTVTDLLKGLGANLSASLNDGVYRGMDLGYEVRRAQALFSKEPAPEAPAKQQTPIRAMALAGTIVDGTLRTDRLTAETDYLKLLGKGGVNLLEPSLDYQLDAQVLQAAAGSGKLRDLAGATIPMTISGPVTAPKIGVDLKGLATNVVRGTLEQKARDALRGKLGGADDKATPQAPDKPPKTEPKQQRQPAKEAAEQPSSARDLLEQGLRDLLKAPPREDRDPN